MDATFDYIIIGAGSAGCVLANRLSEDPSTRVLVLEYGGSDNSIFIQMPTALSIPMNGTKYNWKYMTLPEPGLDGRRVHCPRGKVLGGSSSINGLVYMRGHARDFDEWAERGARGWGYANCLPYFQRAESWQEGGDTYRGEDGPLALLLDAIDSASRISAKQGNLPFAQRVERCGGAGPSNMIATPADPITSRGPGIPALKDPTYRLDLSRRQVEYDHLAILVALNMSHAQSQRVQVPGVAFFRPLVRVIKGQ